MRWTGVRSMRCSLSHRRWIGLTAPASGTASPWPACGAGHGAMRATVLRRSPRPGMSLEIFLLGATSPRPRALACAEVSRATRSGWRRNHAEQMMITHPPEGETRSPVRTTPASRTTSGPRSDAEGSRQEAIAEGRRGGRMSRASPESPG
jgi:hypothetical protein